MFIRSTWLVAALAACSGPDDPQTDTTKPTTPTDTDPLRYDFDSRFEDGSSVAYSGQSLRHLLIDDLKAHLGGMTARVDGGWFPVPGEVEAELDFYFSFDSATSGSVAILKSTDPAAQQATYDDLASDKDLVGKIAGNDPEGQHVDWSTGFIGWPEVGVTTPESLVRAWFTQIEAAAIDRSNGIVPVGPDGAPIASVYLTAEGQDLQQLMQKFLLGAIAFSQGADDYLDDDLPGSGLLSANALAEEGEPYSALEHAWDEGFGYFGAARDSATWTDELLDGAATSDTWVADGAIDLGAEVSWGASTNAGKRDLGSSASAPTDFTGQAWEGFWEGRALIASADGELDDAELDELRGWRDQALSAWEGAMAATVVHYINDVLRDIGAFGTPEYAFADHAKHWSELKGFALALQFSPHSPFTDADFVELHAALGTAPVLPDASAAEIAQHRDALITVRTLLGAAYGFAPVNLGDENGENGW